ncbi:type I secretion system permease/ATPase [Magnetococcus sp. PR-3]|uniref:type I secretion system permease/ATPase n=1 Tax=Magnetococcus sp. PR-3 TaxID=3120355 RepID=UPI002FCE15E7
MKKHVTVDPLASCLAYLAGQQGRTYSPHALTANLPLDEGGMDAANFTEAAARAGFHAEYQTVDLEEIPTEVLPVIVLLKEGAALLMRRQDQQLELILPGGEKSPVYMSLAQLQHLYAGQAIYIKDIFLDSGDEIRKYVDALAGRHGWFRTVLFRFKSLYLHVAVASLVGNLLGIVSSLYVMNVYDRVIPNQAEITLLALSIGVTVAYLFDFLLKVLRAYFVDVAGKKADVILSSVIFSAVMNVRLSNQPGSSGSFASVIRDFDSVRDFFTSSTLTAFIDAPFVLLYVAVIFMIGGPLGSVVLGAAMILLGINVLLQLPMKRLVNDALREASYKHSILVESLTALEQVKALGAQGVLRGKWERVTGVLAINSMKTKFWGSLAQQATVFVQQLTTMVLVFWGCYAVFAGDLTMGGLIACVILTGRAMQPLGVVTSLASRYQGMRMALENIDQFMAKENEMGLDKSLLSRPVLRGGFEFEDVTFSYPKQSAKALDGVSFKVAAGEKIAILGKNGSGKTSILRLLMDYYAVDEGSLRLDGVNVRQLDVADLRNNISYLPQNPSLFLGSLRDNIKLANPLICDETFVSLLHDSGLEELVQGQDQGLDLQVGELGSQLSGGQRQMVALAAALANEGNLVLMDEPTAALDKAMEIQFIARMQRRLADKTLILCTHQPDLLSLVERILILDQGRIVMDGPRDKVLQQLAENQQARGQKGRA